MADTLAVVAAKVHALSERVRNMSRAFWALVIVIVGALLAHTFGHVG